MQLYHSYIVRPFIILPHITPLSPFLSPSPLHPSPTSRCLSAICWNCKACISVNTLDWLCIWWYTRICSSICRFIASWNSSWLCSWEGGAEGNTVALC